MKAVGVVLGVALEPAVVVADEILRVGFEVAIGVAREPEVRRFRDENAAIEDLDRARQDQLVEKDRPLVHLAVVVLILEDRDATERFSRICARRVRHEPEHLDDPQPAFEVVVDRDRIDHHRFAGDELDAIAGRDVKRLELGVRCQRRRII